jgi:hypothetical protein
MIRASLREGEVVSKGFEGSRSGVGVRAQPRSARDENQGAWYAAVGALLDYPGTTLPPCFAGIPARIIGTLYPPCVYCSVGIADVYPTPRADFVVLAAKRGTC